jgi:hypothetical protein
VAVHRNSDGRRARAIRSLLLLEKTTAFYADEPEPAVSWQAGEGVDPDEDDVKAFLAAWVAARKQRATARARSVLSAWTDGG